MSPIDTGEITPDVFAVRDSFVNMFLVKDSIHYIAVDAGNKPADIAEELKKLKINPEQVIAVLLTHTDGDHVAALKLFKNAKIYLSKQEEQLLNGEKSRFFVFGNNIGTTDYLLLNDQQTITIGNTKIKGILTEGHTPGSMCYVINDKYLFTGDAISLKEGRIGKFNKFFNVDTKTAVKSMGLLAGLEGIEYIFTAHYGYTSDYKKAISGL